MKVSFDFDFTLSLYDNSLNYKTVPLFRNCQENGDEIYVITSRLYSDKSHQEIVLFLEHHNLPVLDIFHCGGFKTKKLLELGIEKHFDDSKLELQVCRENGIEAIDCFDNDLYVGQWIKEYGEL